MIPGPEGENLYTLTSADRPYRVLVEEMGEGAATLSQRGTVLYANRCFADLLGCSRDQLGGDAPTLVAATWRDVTHPDDVSVGEGLLNDLVAGTISSFRVRKRYLKPDGSVLWGDLSISCVRNDDGSVRNFIVQIMDISEQVQAEQSLAESEEQYRLLAENASDVVMRLSLNRRYEWASGSVEDVLGWKAPDLLGHCIDEFIHPDDLVRFRQVVADAGLRTAASVEFRFRRPDHTHRRVGCRTRVKGGG